MNGPVEDAMLQRQSSGTKDRLIAAARELMIERNIADFSLHDVAERSGLNSALVKYHFGNKDGLLLAILERDAGKALSQMERLVALDITATAKLRAHVSGVIETYYRFPYLNRLVHLLMHEKGKTSAAKVSSFFVEPLAAFQQQILAQGIASGEFKQVEPSFFYHSVIGACDHLFSNHEAMRIVWNENGLSDSYCRRYTNFLMDLVVDGMAKPGMPKPA